VAAAVQITGMSRRLRVLVVHSCWPYGANGKQAMCISPAQPVIQATQHTAIPRDSVRFRGTANIHYLPYSTVRTLPVTGGATMVFHTSAKVSGLLRFQGISTMMRARGQ
jgi:hypothetical protein